MHFFYYVAIPWMKKNNDNLNDNIQHANNTKKGSTAPFSTITISYLIFISVHL